jgi:LuxR family maltose regulon positive regulatory protein
MPTPILATRLHVPAPRPKLVFRPRLIEWLNDALRCKLTLVSAPAGFGKTTLISEWVAGCRPPVAWLSLDQGDNDPARFVAYLVAALQPILPNIGKGALIALESPQSPPVESILTTLLNELADVAGDFVLVLDDYHAIDSRPVDNALTFLLEHLPPSMHLVIATREDPQLPLGRLRAAGQLTELRITDLRFGPNEAAEFLNRVMGLGLSPEDIGALEARTEGWIAGLQLAAISLQGHQDPATFIKSFTGSHHFVMDYLVEEVLRRQSPSLQSFLLGTSILQRMCGSLCDAVLLDPSGSGQETLEYLERANLFIVPLDTERRWYRYHHLFADLLRQRLQQGTSPSSGVESNGTAKLHTRASEWYEDNGLELEAFHHATVALDYERAERLIEGKGMPLHFRGAVAPVLNWLESLPPAVLDRLPSLWTAFASTLLVTGQTTRVEPALQSAEAVLHAAEPDEKTRDLVGRIAAIRATLAASQNQVETVIAQSRRALEYLHPSNLAFRTSTTWKLGYCYRLQGDLASASQAFTEVISIGKASGNFVFTFGAIIGLGGVHEAEARLDLAEQQYRIALKYAGTHPLRMASEAYLGLARILYEWNDLGGAALHANQSIELARQIENTDRVVAGEAVLARVKLARQDLAGASAILEKAGAVARRHNFTFQVREIAATQVLVLLHQGNVGAAAELARRNELPLSQARVRLAEGNAATAMMLLEPLRREAEARGWEDEHIKVMVLQALAHYAGGEADKAAHLLGEAMSRAEPGGFIRLFVDEGATMARLLSKAAARRIMPGYVAKLLAVFETEPRTSLAGEQETAASDSTSAGKSRQAAASGSQPLIEPLSQRELEVLRLIAAGLSNREISERLFVALITVKGHNQRIFGKLQVQRRTEAVARARELGLL